MFDENSFDELIQLVRKGNDLAAEELLRRYEPHVRRVIRVRMTDHRLRRQMDSLDICQSVMADFYVRVALGQFEISTPEQLIALLATMARNRVVNHLEKQRAARRDVRRTESGGFEENPVPSREATPSEIVAGRELLARAQDLLTPDEQRLAEMRSAGRSWHEIAATLGGSPDAQRIRLSRAMERVAKVVGLAEVNDA